MKNLLVLLLGVIIVTSISCSAWLEDPYPMRLDVPQESSKGRITITNNGCCFEAGNVTVFLLDTEENRHDFFTVDRVYYRATFETDDVPYIETPIQVGVGFTSHYSIVEDVTLIVDDFANTEELLKEGLLIYFDEGFLLIRNGDNEKEFAAGTWHGGSVNSPWERVR